MKNVIKGLKNNDTSSQYLIPQYLFPLSSKIEEVRNPGIEVGLLIQTNRNTM